MITDFLPKSILSAVLRFILSALFIISFISKVGALEPIELSIVEMGISNWKLAPIFSRFILAVELALGIAFLLNILRNWTFYCSQALLLVFSAFLIYSWVKYGNEGDCGCFGSFMEMTPKESLIKNVIMMGLITAWYFLSKEEWKWKTAMVVTGFALICLGLPYVLDYPYFEKRGQTEFDIVNYPLDVETLGPLTFSDSTKPDFTKGEYLIAVLSLKCPHCVNTAHKLAILDRQQKLPVVYSIFIGKEERLKDFQEKSRSSFPYTIYHDKKLMKVTGPEYPIVIHVKDGIIKHKWNYIDDKSFIEAFPEPK